MKIAIVVPPDSDLLIPPDDHPAFARRDVGNIVDKGLRVAALMKALRRRSCRVVEVAPQT